MKKSFAILIPFVLVFLFNGCIDEPVSPESYIINGHVINPSLLYTSEFLVSTGDYPIVSTDINGNFETQAISKPFNLIVTEHFFFIEYSGFVLKFADLTLNKPIIIYGNVFYNYYYYIFYDYSSCLATVHFPLIEKGKKIFLKFMSSEVFDQPDYEEYIVYDDSLQIYVRIPPGKNSISGKLCYLETTTDGEYGEISSYDKYGSKNVTFTKGTQQNIVFSNEDIAYNPEEILMPVEVNLTEGFATEGTVIYLTIPEMFKQSGIHLKSLRFSNEKVIIPLLPEKDFKIKVHCYYSNNFGSYMSTGEDWIYVNPGNPAVLTRTETINLIAPPNEAENITDATIFEISDSEGPAVYEFNIFNYYTRNIMRFYTNKKTVKFSDFRARYFDLPPGTRCNWTVRKFPGYNNADEFVSQPYVIDNTYDYIEVSGGRTFKTAP